MDKKFKKAIITWVRDGKPNYRTCKTEQEVEESLAIIVSKKDVSFVEVKTIENVELQSNN